MASSFLTFILARQLLSKSNHSHRPQLMDVNYHRYKYLRLSAPQITNYIVEIYCASELTLTAGRKLMNLIAEACQKPAHASLYRDPNKLIINSFTGVINKGNFTRPPLIKIRCEQVPPFMLREASSIMLINTESNWNRTRNSQWRKVRVFC